MDLIRKYFDLPIHKRTWLMTEGCMVINLILATFHLTLGFSGRSDLMLIMGFFYALLSFMRFFLAKSVRCYFKNCQDDRMRGTLLLSGMLMIILGLILGRIFTNLVENNQPADFGNASTVLFSIFALSKIVMTGYGLNLSRKQKDPIFSLIQRTTLTETIFCSFSVWLSLIPYITDPTLQETLFLYSGNVFSGFVLIMGLVNIFSYRKYESSVNRLNIPTYEQVNQTRNFMIGNDFSDNELI
ncbi:hypothetical protein [Ileibacterium valens]|uniref:hypothetical protein n=1 Tax=Ileibacterium valens TaxID=1862668 RepID=UPI00259BE2D2|nr:hypothetical protein [Ileibacterium valens]